MTKNKLNEVYIGYTFNSYQIYTPSIISRLILEFENFYQPGQNLNLSIEEFLYNKIIKLFYEFDTENVFFKKEVIPFNKMDLFQIIYSYNLSMDAILNQEKTEMISLVKYLEIYQNSPKFNLAEKRQMKRQEISFTPSLQKINKFYLGISILLWFLIYFIIFYYKFI